MRWSHRLAEARETVRSRAFDFWWCLKNPRYWCWRFTLCMAFSLGWWVTPWRTSLDPTRTHFALLATPLVVVGAAITPRPAVLGAAVLGVPAALHTLWRRCGECGEGFTDRTSTTVREMSDTQGAKVRLVDRCSRCGHEETGYRTTISRNEMQRRRDEKERKRQLRRTHERHGIR